MCGDLAVVEAEVELRDDHRTLPLGETREQASHLHAVEERVDVALARSTTNALERERRQAYSSPRAPHRHHEEPAGEVGVVRRRPPEPGGERVVQRVERAVAVAKDREERAIDARELQSVQLRPAAGVDRHRPPCNATGGRISLARRALGR